MFPTVSFHLPEWVPGYLETFPKTIPDIEDRMRLAIGLARENIRHKTGGPFGAAIFDANTHELVAVGVNLVVPFNCAILHAETVCISMAQKIRGTFDLGGNGQSPLELMSSTEPCAMCGGAVVWSGVRRLVCGARDIDARAIGFDEGPKSGTWRDYMENIGINVVQDVCRAEGAAVLQEYKTTCGHIYNGRVDEDKSVAEKSSEGESYGLTPSSIA